MTGLVPVIQGGMERSRLEARSTPPDPAFVALDCLGKARQ